MAATPRTRLCLVSAALLGLAVATTGCVPASPPLPPDRSVDAGEGNRSWYGGTPEMQAGLRELIARIPQTQGEERIDVGRRIVSYGEPAVPALVQALQAPDADTRGTAAWLLGFLGDTRAADALVTAAGDRDRLVAYEAAGSLLRLDDERGFPPLVQGLEDPDPRVRSKCALLLENHTGETFGYRADLAPGERSAAVARWRAYVASRSRVAR